MKQIIFIIPFLLMLACKKKDNVTPSPVKDTVAVFKLWGDKVNTVNLTFTQGSKVWSKSFNYDKVYTYDNPLEVLLPVSGVKPVGFEIKMESNTMIGSGSTSIQFKNMPNYVKVDFNFGGIVE
jgi:hypothetical protein